MLDFFISYTQADRPWAAWLAWQLEEAGYTTLLDVWDMRPGANFILDMQQATVQAERTLLVLSPDYLSALFPQPEWAAALAHDPTGRQGTLLPVRVRECTPPGMLRPLLYIDLVGLDEATARDTLLAGVRRERAKPTTAPGFPGSQPRAVPQQPLFPGTVGPPAQTPPQPVRVPIPARVWSWLVRNRQWVWSGIGTALLMALLAYFLTQKPEPTAGRDVNRIDNSGGPAVIQTGKGKIEINQGGKKAMKLHRWRDVVCLISLVVAVSLTPVSAADPQRVERAGRDVNVIESSAGPAIIQTDKGTVIINNIQGIDPEEHRAIAKQLGVTEQALENFFAIVDQQQVPLKDLDAKLREIAEHYKTLLSNVRALSSDDPEVARLRNEAEMALKAGEFARAEGLLNEASAKDIAAIQALEEQQTRLQTARKQRQLSAAKAKAANGDLKNTQLAYGEAAAYYRQAVELFPEDEPLTLARYLNEQGIALYRAGQYAEARPSLEKALTIREKVLGPEHPDTALSLNNLGALLDSQGKLAEAQPYYARALAIWEKVLGPDHPDTATSLNNLGYLLQAQGKLAEAQPYYARALAIREKVLGPEHPNTALSLNNLGYLLQAQGKLAEAQPYYARALAIWEKVLGPDHPDTATSLNNLAELYRVQGRYAEALSFYRRTLVSQEKTLGPEHDDTLSTMNTLALVLFGQGDVAGTRQLQEKLLEMHQRLHGPDHPDTLVSMNNLAKQSLLAQGEYARARHLLEQVLDIWRQREGPEHPSTLISMNNLAEILRAQGNLDAARALLEPALDTMKRRLGPQHPRTLACLHNLAETLRTQGEVVTARPMLVQVLEARQQVLGPRHPDTTVSAGALWETLYTLGEAATAETLAAEYLQWLLEADETMLAADQRKVRAQFQQRMGTAKVQTR